MNPETIAYWFFRLNGCATITNFVVHPDRRGSQRTDVDVLAVRFPYWHEILTFIFDRLTRYQAQKAHHGQCESEDANPCGCPAARTAESGGGKS